jgi:phosphomannomutase/phosphoglucomutase
MPKLVATPEIILSAPDAVKFQIIDEITQALQAQYEVTTLDGARAQFEHGWGLIRASNTQPAVTLRFEAYSAPQLVEYMNKFKALLDQHPEVDQSRLIEQINRFSNR